MNSKGNIKSIFCVFMWTLLFMSCKTGQTYKQPSLQTPTHFRGDSIADESGKMPTLALINWRDFFQDEVLRQLIDSSLVFNYDMRSALKNIDIANRQFLQNKANYLPSVGLDIAAVNKQWRSENFYSNPSSNWYTEAGKDAPKDMYTYISQFGSQINLSWEIDIWGKIRNKKDELLAEYLDTQEARNAIQTNLISNVAKGYFNLLILDAKIEVAKRNVQLSDSTLRMIKLQYQAGEITALAIQQTESQRLLAASLVPELEKEIAIQENALRLLAGRFPDTIQRSNSFNQILMQNQDQASFSLGSPIAIVKNRPDIRSAELNLIAANAQVNIRQILRYPSLTLGGAFGLNAMLPQNWFNIPGALLGSFTGGLSVPIFKNKTLKTQFEVAKIEREKAELNLQRTVLEAVSEVSNAVVAIDKQHIQLDYANKRVENAQLAVRNASLLFRSGYATYLEVITAQSNALNSDLALVGLKQRQLESYVDLYRSLGGGWN